MRITSCRCRECASHFGRTIERTFLLFFFRLVSRGQIVVAASGDLRNAIATLQFSAVPDDAFPSQIALSQLERLSKSQLLSKPERSFESREELSTLFAGRDLSLSLFHAIGKILYNKRAVLC